MSRSKFDIPHADECAECEGQGVTRATAPVFADGETIAQGSACPRCLGTGRTGERNGG